jgi:hypothetical protein
MWPPLSMPPTLGTGEPRHNERRSTLSNVDRRRR